MEIMTLLDNSSLGELRERFEAKSAGFNLLEFVSVMLEFLPSDALGTETVTKRFSFSSFTDARCRALMKRLIFASSLSPYLLSHMCIMLPCYSLRLFTTPPSSSRRLCLSSVSSLPKWT